MTDDTVTTDADSARYLIGDHYDETADWPIEKLADRLRTDILDVQRDDMIPAEAAFVVDGDESGPQSIIHITISGLHTLHDTDRFLTREGPTLSATVTVFGLAGNYNRVERARPANARFLVQIDAVTADGDRYSVLVGTIHRWDW
jgi:hypothetical protein